ncbi:periplasmic nitrate reductase subunit NapB [Magnetococcus marinus MC-1]|uniref:Periplasmic nitrate reductase, electron transfer subunit n=1 Tax=Magnetococcus marinus (strain ATCC BAA-1437 / JCM 17883 / MC-1) TaxID=156889 RepID=A0L804_MAGMM|nr:nitrate reductase cytochrome c-type subunit [Magnetococcus marinus]ABK44097.1 periplasmic nitrate reductase subunit NapB [Magnetococcus marinus MC-1]
MNSFARWMVMGWMACFALLGVVSTASANEGGVQSLRGVHGLDSNASEPDFKKWNEDQKPIKRDYLQQPPLIPHSVEQYRINLRQNRCLSCHSWETYKQSGATKISLTHFRDRYGSELADVSPGRYFCTQCHVPQRNAQPLVENTFKPVDALR